MDAALIDACNSCEGACVCVLVCMDIPFHFLELSSTLERLKVRGRVCVRVFFLYPTVDENVGVAISGFMISDCQQSVRRLVCVCVAFAALIYKKKNSRQSGSPRCG